ncbi:MULTISPECIES: DEAD/DEAH box helicase [unclassified Streptomyces]|uniref:DEAD/DEAH box helicase n=1 Tax=unclassified Streptomyces TaxID=2593676 RepID=UPI002DD86A6B|nr:Helicase associated domain protein [Streptomyces sp. NBC_01760]WSC66973.1 Helicase associated domain protein [Streptomyces sp. NBC_01760]WTI84760.1 Helicase associated domain protein [Streptomyces sp. NBC_00724]WTI92166.1 Helicase associated domain protein [Streptomyces sp. NBC_00724]
MTSTEKIVLRPHQVEAVDAVVRGLDIPPGKRIPRNGMRATVVAACGTGKTLIAAHSALRLARNGRVLVLLPTLDLLTQTVREWRSAGHTGPAVAVCSLDDDPHLWDLDVRSTTSPPQLALWHGRGPVTVYATYASLPVLAEAHEGAYGLPMDVFDLVVVDEAHRTSGAMGKAWAAIHDQGVIPAMRRLYMTATPRIWKERPPRARWAERQEGFENARDPLPQELACSMDDPKIYGPVVYELSLASAVSRGLLARYQIVVVELADPVVTPARLVGEERREEQLRGERMGALQAALLETMAVHDLQTTITFHHRTIEASAFAKGLARVAQQLHASDPERYPERVWADWLCGEHEMGHRRAVLSDFGRRAGRAVLSNCRVLGEGVDIRAVDSVALLDPKGSAVDIVQAIGRALRQKPGQGKIATLIVPVFLARGEQPEDMFTSSSYRPLVKVLEGLRAHDERAVEMLTIPQESQKQVVDPSQTIGPEPEDGEEESRLLLRFAAPRDPVMIAKWVKFQILDTERQDWTRGYDTARRYFDREGSLDVPYEHTEGAYPLGRWLSDQRRSYRAGTMSSTRANELEELGMIWDTADTAFAENLAAARAYHAQAGTLAAPRHATALDKPVGQWLTNLRRPGGLGKDPERAARRAEQLAAIDPDWNPGGLGWTVDWQRHYTGLRVLLVGGAGLEEIVPGVTHHGDDIGRWLARQQRDWGRHNEEQRRRLVELGVKPAVRPRKEPAKAGTASAGSGKSGAAFQKGLEALAQYVEREGVMPSRGHVEVFPDGTEHRTGIWIGNQKARRDKLDAEQLRALAGLGVEWAV